MKAINITGQIFHNWLVLRRSSREEKGVIYWWCECKCGNISEVTGSRLKANRSKSCGCLKGKLTAQANRNNLEGKSFNYWTVISLCDKIVKYKQTYWKCKCVCGTIKSIKSQSLLDGTSKSCGCYRKERNTKHGLYKTNTYKNFYTIKRRLAKLKRTPKWTDMKKIKEIYLNCPKDMQVDHIVPLQGEFVSGLHVVENLQYLTPKENQIKANKF